MQEKTKAHATGAVPAVILAEFDTAHDVLHAAEKVQANDVNGLKAATMAEYARDFNGIGSVVGSTAPKITGGTPVVEQVYLLDGSELKGTADAQFFCSLNKSTAEVDFMIPSPAPMLKTFSLVSS